MYIFYMCWLCVSIETPADEEYDNEQRAQYGPRGVFTNQGLMVHIPALFVVLATAIITITTTIITIIIIIIIHNHSIVIT